MNERIRIAVFASHGGSNLQALIDGAEQLTMPADVVLVVSNNRKAHALERAEKHGIRTLVISDKQFPNEDSYANELLSNLREESVNLICLAGYMKKIPKLLLHEYPHRILNIHPALLPKFGGKGMYGRHVHEAVLAAGESETGVTVHLIDEIYDHGRILAQKRLPINVNDDPDTLQKRVLKLEHKLYPEVIAKIAAGEISLE
jgi:phosphoribosylglycinamide formyltransferase-1